MLQAAHAARTTKTFLGQLYRRLAACIEPPRAALAVAHRILRIVFHMRKEDAPYQALGVNYHDERTKAQLERRHTRALERLGFRVSLVPA
ncbi:MAG: IS110 family transposase, partial [Anaerolinea sp.]|nr:IS110 family transposase [Anaerolinea sp.]